MKPPIFTQLYDLLQSFIYCHPSHARILELAMTHSISFDAHFNNIISQTEDSYFLSYFLTFFIYLHSRPIIYEAHAEYFLLPICSPLFFVACGGNIRRQSNGVITSPGYPGVYPNRRDCVWTIVVSPGNVISFAFGHLAIETHANCSFDYLEVRFFGIFWYYYNKHSDMWLTDWLTLFSTSAICLMFQIVTQLAFDVSDRCAACAGARTGAGGRCHWHAAASSIYIFILLVWVGICVRKHLWIFMIRILLHQRVGVEGRSRIESCVELYWKWINKNLVESMGQYQWNGGTYENWQGKKGV